MRELPDGWTVVQFGSVNEFKSQSINPATYPEETFELWSVPSFATGKPELATGVSIGSTKQQVQPKDVLVCKINPRINRVWQVEENLGLRQIASSEWIVFRSSILNSTYLQHFFSSPSFRDQITSGVTGVGGSLTRAQPARVATFSVPIAPLNEQKRIADKLDRLLARVDACRKRCDRIPLILKRFRQSVLAAATSGELTEDWREERNLRFEDWQSLSLEDVVNEVKNGIGVKPDENPSGIHILRISSVRPFSVNFDDYRRLSLEFAPDTYLLEQDDLLFTRYNGTLEFVGVCARVRALPSYPVVYPDKLIRVRVNKSQATPGFIEIATNSPLGRNTIEGLAKTSAGQTGISGRDLKGVPITLPSLEEQQEIVRRVEKLFTFANRLEARYQKARAQVNRLTPALLDKAFQGELVPQDPNDEPASVLLEQIRSELAAAKTNKPERQQRITVETIPSIAQVIMLNRKDIQPSHLSSILKTRGSLTAEDLWTASQLEIDDFYDQLKDEEEQGLLRERRGEDTNAPRLLEVA